MKNLFKTLFALSIVAAIACKKQDTPAPVIVTGMPGTITIKTQDTLSVYYSDWLTPETVDITTDPGNDGNHTGDNGTGSSEVKSQSFSFKASAPFITQTILDKGVVLGYCRLASDGGNTRSLAANTTISGVLNIWNFVLSVGNIQFTRYSMSPIFGGNMGAGNHFRYVVIPSNAHLRLRKPLNEMTYDEVCEMFSIPK